jgi:hypothetical protein
LYFFSSGVTAYFDNSVNIEKFYCTIASGNKAVDFLVSYKIIYLRKHQFSKEIIFAVSEATLRNGIQSAMF